jgi:hypothetical protein
MSVPHHGGMSDETKKLFADQAAARKRFIDQVADRAQRAWPEGRVSGDDDGELAFAVGPHPEQELVVIDFGKPVEWTAMPPQQAIELAQALAAGVEFEEITP